MTGDPLSVRLRALVLPVALLAATALVVVLALQLERVREELEAERLRATHPSVGLVVPPVKAASLEGDSILIGEGTVGSRQVLFVFNTTCGFCIETLPAWAEIARSVADEPHISVLGWSQDSDSATRAFATTHDLPFPVAVGLPHKYLVMYHAQPVPGTIVIDDGGTVLYAARGIVDRQERDSVLNAARSAR